MMLLLCYGYIMINNNKRKNQMSVSLNFHQITKIEVEETTRNETHRKYDVRKLTIYHDGNTTEINLFSQDITYQDDKPLSFKI